MARVETVHGTEGVELLTEHACHSYRFEEVADVTR